jgi:methylthioribose-1-phosphate isomerase
LTLGALFLHTVSRLPTAAAPLIAVAAAFGIALRRAAPLYHDA